MSSCQHLAHKLIFSIALRRCCAAAVLAWQSILPPSLPPSQTYAPNHDSPISEDAKSECFATFNV